MKWIAKIVTAAQAVLLAQFGAARAADAPPTLDFTEAAEWQAAVSAGTPEALQRYLSHNSTGERRSEAFELIVLSEIEAATPPAHGAPAEVQLSEARRDQMEMLEHDFEPGPAKTDDAEGDGGRLGPY